MGLEEHFDLRLFKLLAEGASNGKIAKELGLATGTVNALLYRYRKMMYIGGTRKNRSITSPIISKAVENFDFDSDVNTRLTMNEMIKLARETVDTQNNTDDVCVKTKVTVEDESRGTCENTVTESHEPESTEPKSDNLCEEKCNSNEHGHTCDCNCKCSHKQNLSADSKYSSIFEYDVLDRVRAVLKLSRENDSTEVKAAFKALCRALIEDGLNM